MTDRKKENGAVVRVVKNKNYTVMCNAHLKNKELSFKAKGLMSVCLSLPDDWNYTIAGLQSLATDGRISVENALKELKQFGFLTISKERTEKGLFKTIYTFYENPQETGVLSSAENLQRITDSGLTTPELPLPISNGGTSTAGNIEQLNTNNKELILNTQINFLDNTILKPNDLFELYKKICIHFPQPQEMTDGRISRLKKHPKIDFWQKVFMNAEKSKLLRDGDSKWFCSDWVIKNDNNALKVYEGNYGGGYEKEVAANNLQIINGDKYANIYKRA